MTHHEQNTAIGQMLEVVIENGLEGLEEAVSMLLNEAMKVERSRALGAEPWQRSQGRLGYANGYKPRQLNSRVGKLALQIPQVRGDVNFYPSALERGLRSERALKLAIAEIYVKGVSTRKVTEVMERLCGLEVTSTEVSRCAGLLDEELEKWRNRPLAHCPYLVLDARYENVRMDGTVRSCEGAPAVCELFNPGRPISIDAMAIHHITNRVRCSVLNLVPYSRQKILGVRHL